MVPILLTCKFQFPDKFEAAIDKQARIPFSIDLGPYKKYWAKFVSEKVGKGLFRMIDDT